MIYDKVPLSAEQLSRVKAMLNGPDFQLFRRCVSDEMHAWAIDSGRASYQAAGFSKETDSAKKESEAGVLRGQAQRLAAFLHVLDYFSNNAELFTISIKHP